MFRVFQVFFKGILKVFQLHHSYISIELSRCFRHVSKVFQGVFIVSKFFSDVSGLLQKFYYKGVYAYCVYEDCLNVLSRTIRKCRISEIFKYKFFSKYHIYTILRHFSTILVTTCTAFAPIVRLAIFFFIESGAENAS